MASVVLCEHAAMQSIDVPLRICGTSGLHADPAGRVVHAAAVFAASVSIADATLGKPPVDAKCIFDVLHYGARTGDTIHVEANGPDEQAAIDAVVRVLTTEVCHPADS